MLSALFVSAAAYAEPVTCDQVVFHWGGLYTEATGHTADSRLLIAACHKLAAIDEHQLNARCVLGTRRLGEDCAGWGPLRDDRGVRYDAWGSPLRNQPPRPQGEARPPTERPPSVDPVATGPVAMMAADFASLLAAVEDESFRDDKMDVIRMAANHAHFSCAQVGELMDLMTFGTGKLEVVELLASRVVDPQNSFVLLDKVSFPSEKKEIQSLFE